MHLTDGRAATGRTWFVRRLSSVKTPTELYKLKYLFYFVVEDSAKTARILHRRYETMGFFFRHLALNIYSLTKIF